MKHHLVYATHGDRTPDPTLDEAVALVKFTSAVPVLLLRVDRAVRSAQRLGVWDTPAILRVEEGRVTVRLSGSDLTAEMVYAVAGVDKGSLTH